MITFLTNSTLQLKQSSVSQDSTEMHTIKILIKRSRIEKSEGNYIFSKAFYLL